MKPSLFDLSTTYLGLHLSSPLVMAASPLSQTIEKLKQLEQHGAGAVVLHSLFERPIGYIPDNVEGYLEHLQQARRHLKIPVIASLNATTNQGWSELARRLELSGASALELNILEMNLSIQASSKEIEDHFMEAIHRVKAAVKIPVAVKMPPYFTNVAFMAKQLEEAGVKGLVLFNRFYQPDFNLKTMEPAHSLHLSAAAENRLPRRWISLLYRPIQADLIANTGIHSGEDVLKMILSGAVATQVCSIILQRGIPWLETLGEELRQAMENCQITSLKEARGRLAHRYTEVAGSVEREEYQTALQGYYAYEGSAPEPSELTS